MASISGRGFDDVDATGDPHARVAYLEAASALDEVRQYKQQSFSLMALRTGQSVLDVGCGTGEDLRELARLVGPTGRVVGVDASETMIEGARVRTSDLGVECQLGKAEQLAFADATFDACRADRVLQHLEDPAQAIRELVRVTRQGGWIVLTEPDWDTLVIDAANVELTRRVLYYAATRGRNGLIGRQLSRLMLDAGLNEIAAVGAPIIVTDWTLAKSLWALEHAAQTALDRGVIADGEGQAWLADLEARGQNGTFFSALLAITVAGHKRSA